MSISEQDIERIVSYHNDALTKAGYPGQLATASVMKMLNNWYAAASSRAEKVFFLQTQPLSVEGLQFPLLKFLTVLPQEKHEKAPSWAEALARLGGQVLLLVESYNREALELLKRVHASETFFCQKKLLGNIRTLAFAAKEEKPPKGVVFRNFVVGSDEDNYVKLYNSTLGFLGARIDKTFIDTILQRPSFNPAGYFFAENNGRAIGFLNVEVEPWGEEGSRFAYIYQIGVEEQWRRTGLASALLQKAIQFVQGQDCDRLGVGVRKSNSHAVNFFVEHGFAEAYRVTGYLVDNL